MQYSYLGVRQDRVRAKNYIRKCHVDPSNKCKFGKSFSPLQARYDYECLLVYPYIRSHLSSTNRTLLHRQNTLLTQTSVTTWNKRHFRWVFHTNHAFSLGCLCCSFCEYTLEGRLDLLYTWTRICIKCPTLLHQRIAGMDARLGDRKPFPC